VFPQSGGAGEGSSGVHHPKGQMQHHGGGGGGGGGVATPAYRANPLPPNPFKEKVSPDSSLSSGPPQSATTGSFSTMTSVDRMGPSSNNQQAGKLVVTLPPRPATNSRKKCSGKSDENGATCAILGRCHCSKRRYGILSTSLLHLAHKKNPSKSEQSLS
jgi:hypothetical protein